MQRVLLSMRRINHRRSQGGQRSHAPQILENIVILCFVKCFSKQNSVIRLKSNILPPQFFCTPPNFWAGYATGLNLFVVGKHRYSKLNTWQCTSQFVFHVNQPASRFCFHGNESAVFEVYLAKHTQVQQYKTVAHQKFLPGTLVGHGPQVEKPCLRSSTKIKAFYTFFSRRNGNAIFLGIYSSFMYFRNSPRQISVISNVF